MYASSNRQPGGPMGSASASPPRGGSYFSSPPTSSSIDAGPLSPAEAQELRADNKLLAMKVKYLQSVTTIYRQKVAAITREALIGMEFGSEQEERITGAIGDAERVAMSAMQQFDTVNEEGGTRGPSPAASASPSRAAQTRALLYGPAPSLSLNPQNEADFWRQQFLNIISEMRPVSVNDAEILMKALSEKKALADEVDALRARVAMGGGGGESGGETISPQTTSAGGGKDGFTPARKINTLADGTSPAPRKVTVTAPPPAPSANATRNGQSDLVASPATRTNAAAHPQEQQQQQIGVVLVTPQHKALSRYATAGGFIGSGTVTLGEDEAGPLQYPSMRPTSIDEAVKLLQEEQTKNKVQRLRIAALQKQLNQREQELTEELISSRNENLRVIAAMKALEKDRDELLRQNHDYRQQLYVSEKTVTLKEGQLHRQQGRTTAVEKELQASVRRMQTVFEQETDRRAAETAALQQAFEEQRRLQTEIQLLKANLEAARRQQEDTDIDLQRCQIMIKSTDFINEQLRSEINKMEQAKLMSEWEADSMLSLLPRMDEAATELEQFFTFREVKVECERMNGQLRNIQSVCKSMLELNKVIERRNEEIRLLRAEADRAVSLGIPPSITAVVDTALVDGRRGEQGPAPRQKPHVMLRQHGTWMEIRDTGSGRLVYVTPEITETPFCPVKIASREEKEKAAKLKAEEEERKHQEALAKAKADEEARALAIAKAVAEERARVEAEIAAKQAEEAARRAEEEKKGGGGGSKKKPLAPIDPAYRPRLIRMFSAYNPSRLNTVDAVMERFRGRYDDMMKKLVDKYGPEPADDGSPLPALPPQISEVPGSVAGSQNGNDDAHDGGETAFLRPLRERLIRLLDKYDKPKLAAVDSYLNAFVEEGLQKLVAQYGVEPTADDSAELPELPPQLMVGGEDAKDLQLQPYRRRLIRLLDKYDKPRLCAVDALMRQHPTPLQAETMLKKFAVRYGSEPIDDDDAKLPELPEQADEVPPQGSAALYPTIATVAAVVPGGGHSAVAQSPMASKPTAAAAPATTARAPSQHASPTDASLAGGPSPAAETPSEASKPAAPITAAAAATMVAPPEVKARLYRMFKKYAPEKLGNIDLVLDSFAGEYEAMFQKLVAKYGPEPEDDGAPMPMLPAQAMNPVLEARKRAASMRQASPPASTLPAKRQPTVTVASPPRTTAASPTTSAASSPTAAPLRPPLAAKSVAPASSSPTPTVSQQQGGKTSPPPTSTAKAPPAAAIPKKAPAVPSSDAAPSSPSGGATSPRKVPPAAALAAMKAAQQAPPAATPPTAKEAMSPERTASPPKAAAKAPPAAALAAMKAAQKAPPSVSFADSPQQGDAGKSPSPPRAAKAPPAAALAAMKSAQQSPVASANPSPNAAAAPGGGGGSPRAAKAPPAAALAAMKAAQKPPPKSINSDDI